MAGFLFKPPISISFLCVSPKSIEIPNIVVLRLNKWNTYPSGETRTLSKIFAFYLPQFHRIKENNEWWGSGFTEWTNVSRARPVFPGHSQPDIPGALGFYDLTNPESLVEQVSLAKKYQVDGFIFYNYWFSGQKLLNRPVELFAEKKLGFPFALCWANENWTKNWDGGNKEILLLQNYDEGFEKDYVKDHLSIFSHEDYIKIEDRPALIIYRPELFPRPRHSISNFRNAAFELGLGPVHVIAVSSYETYDPRQIGADAVVEFPPLGTSEKAAVKNPHRTIRNFKGHFYDYGLAALQSANEPKRPFKRYRSVMPGWDNTPRRQLDSTIFLNSNPEVFSLWLASQLAASKDDKGNTEQPVFVNAWNEWAEGAHLEPSRSSGTSYLEAVIEARKIASARTKIEILGDLSRTVKEKYTPQGIKSKPSVESDSRTKLILARLAREINIQNINRLFMILKSPNPLRQLSMALRRASKSINSSKHPWKPVSYISEESNSLDSSGKFLALTAHLFYEDYVDILVEVVSKNPVISKVLVTTTSDSILQRLKAAFGGLSIDYEIRLTANRGRNFGPLFSEFRKEILEHKYFIHLHSKKSKHTRKSVASDWSGRFWRQFGLDESLLHRTLAILEANPALGLSYPLVTDIISPVHFAMHSNAEISEGILEKLGLRFEGERFAYPAGGMFIAKSKSLQPLLEMEWRLEDFPPELNQMDGTTQHALERLVGLVPTLQGFGHLVFDSLENSFTIDESYVNDPDGPFKNA